MKSCVKSSKAEIHILATFQRHQLFLKTNQEREWFRFVIHASFLKSWIRGLLPRSSWAWGKLLTRKTITAEGDTIRLCIGGKCKSCVPLLSYFLMSVPISQNLMRERSLFNIVQFLDVIHLTSIWTSKYQFSILEVESTNFDTRSTSSIRGTILLDR